MPRPAACPHSHLRSGVCPGLTAAPRMPSAPAEGAGKGGGLAGPSPLPLPPSLPASALAEVTRHSQAAPGDPRAAVTQAGPAAPGASLRGSVAAGPSGRWEGRISDRGRVSSLARRDAGPTWRPIWERHRGRLRWAGAPFPGRGRQARCSWGCPRFLRCPTRRLGTMGRHRAASGARGRGDAGCAEGRGSCARSESSQRQEPPRDPLPPAPGRRGAPSFLPQFARLRAQALPRAPGRR